MKRTGIWLVLVAFGVAVTGCATTQAQPGYYAYPQRGQTPEQLSRDQYECQAWAQQQSRFDPATDTTRGAATGGVLGALGGAAAGAAIGAATGGGAGRGAAIGATTGGIGGVVLGGSGAHAQGKDGYDRAYAACMTGRGYVVR